MLLALELLAKSFCYVFVLVLLKKQPKNLVKTPWQNKLLLEKAVSVKHIALDSPSPTPPQIT